MRTRRGFIGAATATAAIPVLAPGLAARAAGREPAPDLVVYDSDFAEAVGFAEEASRLGLETHPIEGDVTGLWLRRLSLLWRERPGPVAGLTRQGALFCLERLAWDAGMRVVLQIDHARSAAGTRHAVFGAGDRGPAVEAALDAAGVRFGVAAARLLSRWDAREAVIWRTGATAVAEAPEPLVSWMIAPVRAA